MTPWRPFGRPSGRPRSADARRLRVGALVLGLLLALGFVASLGLGAVALPGREVVAALDPDHPLHTLVVDIRLARVLGCAMVGVAFAVSGVLLQTVVRNPLADTGLLGVNAGAGLAVIAAMVLLPQWGSALPFLAFGGALATVGCLLLAVWGQGNASPLKILLSGVAVQALAFAAIAVLSFLYADRTPAFIGFTVGSLQGTTWIELFSALPLWLVALGLAGLFHRSLDLLLVDDASALSAGLAVGRARFFTAVLAAVLASVAVAVAGLVSFVGLLVPNTVRLLTGPSHRRLLPFSAAAGAALMIFADLVARWLWRPIELPVGAILALLGGPYFLYLLWRKLP